MGHLKNLETDFISCCPHEKIVKQRRPGRVICDLCDRRLCNISPGARKTEAFCCTECRNSGSSGFDVCMECAKDYGIPEDVDEIPRKDLEKAYMEKHSGLLRRCPYCQGSLELKDGKLCCTSDQPRKH